MSLDDNVPADVDINEDEMQILVKDALKYTKGQLTRHSTESDKHLQNFADAIIAQMLKESSERTIKLALMDSKGRFYKNTFIKLPRNRTCKASSCKRSKRQYARNKADTVEILLDSFADKKTPSGKDMVYKILKILGDDYGLSVFKTGTIQFGRGSSPKNVTF